MSTTVTIQCDGANCGKIWAKFPNTLGAVMQQRSIARQHGWHTKGTKDYCETCAPKHRKPKT